jgi:hypothetical protein
MVCEPQMILQGLWLANAQDAANLAVDVFD